MQLFCGVVFVSWKLYAYFSFCIQFMHLIYVCIEFTFVAVSLPSCKALSQFTISGTSASTETAPATCGIQGWADLPGGLLQSIVALLGSFIQPVRWLVSGLLSLVGAGLL